MTEHSPIYVTSPGLPPFNEYVDEIRDIWDTGILTHQGPKYQALEKRLEEYLDMPFTPLFANGHLALQIALRALGLTYGEVITTPFTFASTTMAIVECGLTPVFCDIDESDYTLDPNKIEKLITPHTKAIVAVHVYGMPCHVEAIERIAKQYGLYVIYDAAHAFGEVYRGENIAHFGDISMFSLHATKVFNSVEGGVLAFKDELLLRNVCAIRQFGEVAHSPDSELIGTNAKMTEIHAAMGLCNLRHLPEYIEMRRRVYSVYEEAFADAEGLRTLQYPSELTPNYAYYPVLFDGSFGVSRDVVAEALEHEGVFARKYFYPLTSDFSAFRGRFPIQDTPIAHSVSERVLCLPLHPLMTPEDAARIAGLVLAAKRSLR